ncbi:hypothetical protein [Falsiroseomonas sp. CW058]|uniref:hypothetical protein n=1 Tax=Falsiroseomonas sp. CW058 TaxID=3388664 RepID=UPI003D31A734
MTPIWHGAPAGGPGPDASWAAWTGPAAGWGERLLGLAMGILHPPGGLPPLQRREAEDGTGALAAAVAAVVAIAAQRARAAGDLPRLRAVIDRALDAAEPAEEEVADAALPCIADADPAEERRRLMALARRQG